METNLSQRKRKETSIYEDVRYKTYDSFLKSIDDEEFNSISPIPKYPKETQHIQNSIRTLHYDEIPSQVQL